MYFLENFDRYLIAVSPIPYIDYSSYEYSILVGPAFTIIYTVGGLVMALGFYEKKVNTHHPRTQRQQRNDSEIGDERETDGMVSQQEIETNPIPLQQHVGIMKFGKYMVITTATFIFSAAFFCTAIATNFWQQVIIRIVMGLAQSVITPFSTSIIRDHFSPSVSGAAFGIFNVGTYIAFSLSLSLGIYIYLTFGWKAGYLLFGLIGAGSAFMLPLLYFLNRNSVHVQQSEGSREEEDRDMEGDTSHGQQSQLLGNEGESNQSEQVTSGGLPTSPTSSYLSQEAITLSALHQHSISSRGSSPMLSQSASQNSFSASQNHSNMMMGMSTNSSHFINSHQQVHLSGSFAHSILSEVTQGTNTVPSANPFLNTNRNTMSSARSSGMGTQQLAGGSSVSMNSASFLQEIPVDLFQVRLGNSQRNHRESFQGSLSTVDVDSEGNQRHHKNSLLSDVDFDEEEYHHVMIRSSLLQRIRFQLRQIVGRYWWKNPGVIMVCIATGVRIGGGYIWSAYTGPFFSDLFQYDSSQSDCVYSYSDVIQDQSTSMIPTVATVFGANVGDGSGSICDSSFPYCVDGTCAALSENPWHNQVRRAFGIDYFEVNIFASLYFDVLGDGIHQLGDVYVLGAIGRFGTW
jgi:MFS family permease